MSSRGKLVESGRRPVPTTSLLRKLMWEKMFRIPRLRTAPFEKESGGSSAEETQTFRRHHLHV